jgi:hypothetical protein
MCGSYPCRQSIEYFRMMNMGLTVAIQEILPGEDRGSDAHRWLRSVGISFKPGGGVAGS